MNTLDVGLTHQVTLGVNGATGDFADHVPLEADDGVPLLGHAHTALHHAEAGHHTVALLLPGHVAPPAHEEGLMGFDVAAETGLPGSQSQRASQLVPV